MSNQILCTRYDKELISLHYGDIDDVPREPSFNTLTTEPHDDDDYTPVRACKMECNASEDAFNHDLCASAATSAKTASPVQPLAEAIEQLSSIKLSQPTSYTIQQRIKQVSGGECVDLCVFSSPQNLDKGANDIQDKNGRSYSALTRSYKKLDDGKLEMINEALLKKQKQVLGFLIKQFGSMLLTGKSVMNISLPITIFEPRSLLEKVADNLGYAPHFLAKAAMTTDTLEQFKLALTFFVANLSADMNPEKPCTPSLGETFQGIIGGSPVYVEQISAQPPLAAFQLLGKGYTIEGDSELQASISVNSVKCRRVGAYKITFKNTGSVITVQAPEGIMNGTAFGKRVWQVARKLQVYDLTNCYYAELDFDKSEPANKRKEVSGYFSNEIYKTTEKFMTKAKQDMQKSKDVEIKFKEKEHASARLAEFEGSWLEFLTISGQNYWTFGNIFPYKVQYFDNPLPSDSNFRLDILHLKNKDEEKAQECKMLIEEQQRKDKKLMENARAKRK